MPTPADQLPPEVRDALKQGNVIEAGKLLRSLTGLGLAEAKSLIDGQYNPSAEPKVSLSAAMAIPAVVEALRSGNKIEAIKLVRLHTGVGMKEAKDAIDAASSQTPGPAAGKLAPGEVARSSNMGWWLVILGLIALAAYFFH